MKGKSEAKAQKILRIKVGHLYQRIKINHHYSKGEIDLMGKLPNGKWDIYEIKSTRRKALLIKADAQLTRAQKYFSVNKKFVYISGEDSLIEYSNLFN